MYPLSGIVFTPHTVAYTGLGIHQIEEIVVSPASVKVEKHKIVIASK